MSYNNFAEFYDELQQDVGYPLRTKYLLELFNKYDRQPTLLLDMACGTGGFSLCFLKEEIDVICVDPSCEMLGVARDKFSNEGYSPLLLCQSAEELDLYGTVDGAVCLLDSLNHIIDKDEFARSIARISLFLEKDRLFIFDLNTEYKHKEVLSHETFVFENDRVFCVWQNSDCDCNGIIDINLDFFSKNKCGTYQRSSEDFSERAYSNDFVEDCLKNAGLKTLAVLGDMSFDKPKSDEQRVIYVTRKVK